MFFMKMIKSIALLLLLLSLLEVVTNAAKVGRGRDVVPNIRNNR